MPLQRNLELLFPFLRRYRQALEFGSSSELGRYCLHGILTPESDRLRFGVPRFYGLNVRVAIEHMIELRSVNPHAQGRRGLKLLHVLLRCDNGRVGRTPYFSTKN